MSYQETKIGKLIRVPYPDNATNEDVMKQILEVKGITIDPEYGSITEQFREECYDDYAIINGSVFKIETLQESTDDPDIFYAIETDYGFDYVLSYYNGGCSFTEALEHAIDKVSKREEKKDRAV